MSETTEQPHKRPVFLEMPTACPIRVDSDRCIGCLACVESCQVDVLAPGERYGSPPRVFYPDECWYCGCCVMDCPADAISLRHPLMNQADWIEKVQLTKQAIPSK